MLISKEDKFILKVFEKYKGKDTTALPELLKDPEPRDKLDLT